MRRYGTCNLLIKILLDSWSKLVYKNKAYSIQLIEEANLLQEGHAETAEILRWSFVCRKEVAAQKNYLLLSV